MIITGLMFLALIVLIGFMVRDVVKYCDGYGDNQ